MIKIILFDLAGPVLSVYDDLFFPWLLKHGSKNTSWTIEQLNKVWEKHMYPAEEDHYSEYEAFERVKKELAIEIESLTLQNKRQSFVSLNECTVELILKLKKKGYKLMFATNNAAEEFARNYYQFDLGNLFDYGRASYHLKSRKTKKVFFEQYIQLLNVKLEEILKPEEIIFIDDGEKNLKAPAELGIKTIHFKEVNQLIDDLKQLGVTLD